MQNYFLTRLLINGNHGDGGFLQIYITDDSTCAINMGNPQPSISHSVPQLVQSVKDFDTSEVTFMLLDIDHSFNCHDDNDSNERSDSVALMTEFFAALSSIKPAKLQTLEVRIDDRQGLSSTDALLDHQSQCCRFSIYSTQSPPLPHLSIIGQSHREHVRFFNVDLSKLSSLTRLTLNFVKIEGSCLQTFIDQATDLKCLKLEEVLVEKFNSPCTVLELFCNHRKLAQPSSLLVTTELHFATAQGSRKMKNVKNKEWKLIPPTVIAENGISFDKGRKL